MKTLSGAWQIVGIGTTAIQLASAFWRAGRSPGNARCRTQGRTGGELPRRGCGDPQGRRRRRPDPRHGRGRYLRALADDGRLVQIAFLSGPKVELNFAVMARRLTITGSTLRPDRRLAKARIAYALRERVLAADRGRAGRAGHGFGIPSPGGTCADRKLRPCRKDRAMADRWQVAPGSPAAWSAGKAHLSRIEIGAHATGSAQKIENENGRIVMRTRAAVAVQAGKPLEIMEVNLAGPKAGEVLKSRPPASATPTNSPVGCGPGLFPRSSVWGAGVVVGPASPLLSLATMSSRFTRPSAAPARRA